RYLPDRSPGAHAMALERHLDQPVDQLRVGDARGFPQLGIHRDRREPWDRLDLVQTDLLTSEEEVHPRHPGAPDRAERVHGVTAYLLRDRIGYLSRDHELASLDEILRLVVVELVGRDNLTDDGRIGLVVPQNRTLE